MHFQVFMLSSAFMTVYNLVFGVALFYLVYCWLCFFSYFRATVFILPCCPATTVYCACIIFCTLANKMTMRMMMKMVMINSTSSNNEGD